MQVNRRSLALGLAAIFAASSAFAAPRKAVPEPIFKVDTVTTSTDGGKLVVTARGAASSGGWTNPHLRQKDLQERAHHGV